MRTRSGRMLVQFPLLLHLVVVLVAKKMQKQSDLLERNERELVDKLHHQKEQNRQNFYSNNLFIHHHAIMSVHVYNLKCPLILVPASSQ